MVPMRPIMDAILPFIRGGFIVVVFCGGGAAFYGVYAAVQGCGAVTEGACGEQRRCGARTAASTAKRAPRWTRY
eukprot:1541050-Rhodomonas_salina.2